MQLLMKEVSSHSFSLISNCNTLPFLSVLHITGKAQNITYQIFGDYILQLDVRDTNLDRKQSILTLSLLSQLQFLLSMLCSNAFPSTSVTVSATKNFACKCVSFVPPQLQFPFTNFSTIWSVLYFPSLSLCAGS
jgi:hypothetical protein